MKISIINLAVSVCLIAPSALAHGGEHHGHTSKHGDIRTVSGVISDSMCVSDHSAMIRSGHGKDDASCTRACWQEGNHAVIIDTKNNVVYKVSNPESVSKFAGETVTLTGDIDNQAKVIHVHSVQAQ